MAVGTAGNETCGYEHYAVRMTAGTAGNETCGYEHYAMRMTAGTAGNETCGYEHYAMRMAVEPQVTKPAATSTMPCAWRWNRR
jgi:hypothetical protein